jgi:DNA-binding XRE family transcriptional regulator
MTASRQRRSRELDVATLRAVRDGLARGESQRALARRLGLHRDTVKQIADGAHVSDEHGERAERCDGCGHKVVKPCKICPARKAREERRCA